MKAIVCNEFGPVEDLAYQETDDPTAEKGQVIVDLSLIHI